ncbi:rod shape-determining protein RodA [Bacteroidota bacterium]|nr:rod shape-determining protein RodA [Bacteroidota bacterium]
MDKRKTTNNLDWGIILLYSVFVAIGLLVVYASSHDDTKPFFDYRQLYIRQLIWVGTSAILAIFILVTDNKFYTSFAYIIYAAVILLVVGVFFFGHEVNGNKNWFEIGSFQLQPSEFAKFSVALALAKFLSNQNINLKYNKHKMMALALIFFPALLIQLQGDTGSTLVFLGFFLVLYRFGLPGEILMFGVGVLALSVFALVIDKFILIGILFFLAGTSLYFIKRNRSAYLIIAGLFIGASLYVTTTNYVFNNVLKLHQQQRIKVLLGQEVNVKDADYNVRQSKIAIGSGGFLGKGPLHGTLTKYNFVPEQHTDFIFCTIGEEYGFWGTSLFVSLFLFFLTRILTLAERQRSKFSRIYAYGVASILFFHFLINIGMTIGLAPVIGIPLPFISYGGSSLWSFTILLFVLIKLDADRLAVLR